MRVMTRHKLVLLVNLLVLVETVVCFCGEEREQWLVSPKLLERAKMELVWETKLPLKESEHLDRLFILGDSIYALSDQNYIVSLNRGRGGLLFSRAFAPAGFTVLGIELYKDKLISVVGGRLVEIDPVSGRELSGKTLGFGVTCPVARNSGYFYMAGADRRLRTFRAEDRVELFEVSAENESVITSVNAGDDYVVFATAGGNVVCITPDRPRRLWQFDAADGIVGSVVRDEQWLFFASRDTHVYKLDITRGSPPVWKYQTEAILETAPWVTGEVVYQYVNDKGVTAIDKKSGQFMWEVKHGAGLLAEAEQKAYVITQTGELVVMDNKKRQRLYSVNFARVSRYVTNMVDSKIYIGNQSGRVVCLRPVK